MPPPSRLAKLKSRLGCEVLEARDVPAVLYWNPAFGAGFEASTAENWRVGSATDSTSNHAAGAADDLFFTPVPFPINIDSEMPPDDPGSGTTATALVSPTCVFTSASGSLFASIHLVGGYIGTVTFQHDIAVGGFEQTSGSIDQTAPGQSSALTLTVSSAYSTLGSFGGAFTWTGGTLNSGVNAGVVRIVGMTNATIGDGTDTSYITGSDIKLLSGTTMIASGSIVLNNVAGLMIGTGCSLDGPTTSPPPPTSPPQPPTIPPPVEPKTWVQLLKGFTPVEGSNGRPIKGLGMVLLKGEATGLGGRCESPILVDGGTLNVVIADLNVTEAFERNPLGQPLDASVAPAVWIQNVSGILSVPKVNIRDGRQLQVANAGVFMAGGALTTQVEATKVDGTLAGVSDHVAFIHGKLVVNGGTVMVGANDQGDTHTVGTLHVSGDIKFLGGTYKPHVYADNEVFRDRWTTDGVFFFKPAAKIDPIIHRPGGVGRTWEVIRGVKGFGDADRPTTTLAADWELEPNELPSNAPADSPRWIRVRKK